MQERPQTFAETVELLRNAQQGDTGSLTALVMRYRPRLLHRIRLMMGQEARRAAESQDFLQNVMLDIVANLTTIEIRDERSFLRWAVQVARNNIRDVVRKRREERFADFARGSVDGSVVDPRAFEPSVMSGGQEQAERVMGALEGLPADQQLVIELRDFEKMSFLEIAGQMQRSENAVQLLHTRALIRLGALLQARTMETDQRNDRTGRTP